MNKKTNELSYEQKSQMFGLLEIIISLKLSIFFVYRFL